jgi:long-chain fatty acid transport protein
MTARRAALATALAVTASAASPALGAAFQLREGDPDWLANAFAGDAAKAYDAGTAWNNPAGMTLLNATEVDQAVNYFDPGIRFTGDDVVNGKPVPGYTGGDAGPAAVSGGVEAVWNFSPDLKFGIATEAPFGLRTTYPNSFVGRYQALTSAITNFQVAFTAAYRLTPQISIGGGPIISYLRARLTQAINVSAFVPNGGDPLVDIHGDAIAAGYDLSALYEASSALRFGIDYKSREGFNITDGSQRVSLPPAVRAVPFLVAVLDTLNSDVSTQVTLPDVLTMSGYYDLTPDWTLLGTAQWTHWSLIPQINVQTPTTVESTPIGFNSTWMESVGVNWRPPVLRQLTLQCGLLYDQGANTDATRGPRLPDEDRIGTAAGFSYALTPATNLRAAYLHEFPGGGGNTVGYSNHFPNAGTLLGTYTNDADVISAGITMRF